MERVGELEINQDVTYQEREWRTERLGWALLILLILVAVAGLFGNGPLSWTTVTTPDEALEVSYERFGRRGGSQDLTLRATSRSAENGEWHIEISSSYLASLEVSSITPEPESVEMVEGAARYNFSQATADADLEVIFAVMPRHVWSQRGELRLGDGEPVTVTQFFFP